MRNSTYKPILDYDINDNIIKDDAQDNDMHEDAE